jgi:hypothetical protein
MDVPYSQNGFYMKHPIKNNDTILVLPSWYPSKINLFAGDFIERHVKAISLYSRQYVIYVIKDDQDKYAPGITSKEMAFDNYTEKIIYYKVNKTGISLLDKLISQIKYKRIYRNAINEYIRLNGRPKIIHVHVAFKAGMLALWAKNKWNIPYVVTEHWTVYLKEADLRFEHFSIMQRQVIKKIILQASALTVVSDWLGKAIQKICPPVHYSVIPNVVDKTIFFPVDPCFYHELSKEYGGYFEGIQHFKRKKAGFCF